MLSYQELAQHRDFRVFFINLYSCVKICHIFGLVVKALG